MTRSGTEFDREREREAEHAQDGGDREQIVPEPEWDRGWEHGYQEKVQGGRPDRTRERGDAADGG